MNTLIETARQKSKAVKKPLAAVTESERPIFEELCARLDAIANADAENSDEIRAIKSARDVVAEAVASGDPAQICQATELEAGSPGRQAFTEALSTNLRAAREKIWRERKDVILGIFDRAHQEAAKRLEKLVEGEIAEANATGGPAYVQSAAANFLQRMAGSIRLTLDDPDKRLRNVRCARTLLQDHAIDPGE